MTFSVVATPAWLLGLFLATAVSSVGALSCANSVCRLPDGADSSLWQRALASKHQRGAVSNEDAACLARSVASRELLATKSEAEGFMRLQESEACAAELDDALSERMKKHDGAGALAALERLESGRFDTDEARAFLSEGDERWHAVGVRALQGTRIGDRKLRQSAVLDASPRVRRSALRASSDAKDVADLDLLFETARVDPDLLLRNEAVRAIREILRGDRANALAPGSVNRLQDLWISGDDAVKADVAVTLALPPFFTNGGREALLVRIALGNGSGAIAAAGVVLSAAWRDAELLSAASALVSRHVAEGSRRDRLHAIRFARPLGVELDGLRKAATDGDREIRIAALARLRDSSGDRESATADLLAMAGQGVRPGPAVDDPSVRAAALLARSVLARAGDRRVQAWIEQDLNSPDADLRRGAASSLAALGLPARAVMLLVDADPSVRMRAACTILVASRR